MALVIGFGLVRVLLPGPMRLCRHDLPRLLLGAAIGMGISSGCFFLSLAAGIPDLALELAVLAAIIAAWWFKARSAECVLCQAAPEPWEVLDRLLAVAFAAALICACIVFLSLAAGAPHGGWDAWSMYNLRARFLYRDPAHWRDGFTSLLAWSHPDYPLLLPGFIARSWKLLGRETVAVPIAVSLLFTFCTAGLLAGAVWLIRDRKQGLLAGLVLLGTPFLIIQGVEQYADVPLAFFLLATVALLWLQDRHPAHGGFSALAGITAGLAAWTKNEGLLMLACVVVARVLVTRRLRPQFLLGLLPFLLIIGYFKVSVAPPTELLAQQGGGQRLLDVWRHVTVATAFAGHIWSFGNLFLSPFLFLGALLALLGLDLRERLSLRATVLALLLIAAGYFAIYVISPWDLNWLLATSLDRLLLQLWPSVIFAGVLAARSP